MPGCARCGYEAVRPLGNARSSLAWFACPHCHHVWAAREARATALSQDKGPPGAPSILVVDDDCAMLRFLQRTLAGYHVVTALDGSEAIALAGSLCPDLVITDYLMPDTTGIELIAWIRQRNPDQRVIVLTGHADYLESESWWATERHLSKPCSVAELLAAVQEMIGAPSPLVAR